MTAEPGIGDRVTVLCPAGPRQRITPRRGQIAGESRDGRSWRVKLDQFIYPIGYHKNFVVLESIGAFNARFIQGSLECRR